MAIAGLMTAVVVLAISNMRIARTSRALAAAVEEKDGALTSARKSEALAKDQRGRAGSAARAGRGRRGAGPRRGGPVLDPRHRGRAVEGPRPPGRCAATCSARPCGSTTSSSGSAATTRASAPRWRTCSSGSARIQQDLGDGAGANKSFLAAREIYQALARAKPDDPDVQAGLADCQFRLGAVPEAIAIYEKLLKLDPTNPRYRRELAEAYNAQATNQNDRSKVAEILAAHRKALALREGLVREFPDDPEARNNLGGTLNNLGVVLDETGPSAGRALAMYRRAVEQAEAAFARAPQVVLYGRYLGTQYSNVASTLRALGRHDEAILAYQRSVEHWRRMTHENPEVPVLRARSAFGCQRLRAYLLAQGRKAEAAEPIPPGGRGDGGPAAEDRQRPVQPGLCPGPGRRRDRAAPGGPRRGSPGAATG